MDGCLIKRKNMFYHTVAPQSWKKPVTCWWGQLTCTKWPRIGVVRWLSHFNTTNVLNASFFFFSDFKMQQFIFLIAAGNAFSQAAHLHLQMQSKHDAATNFIDAGNAFKKADPQGKRYITLGYIISIKYTCKFYIFSYKSFQQ